ncbi:MAG TPA: 1-deoxy-D-xylulose-5-phosphate reductoisomerase [Oculatellaceae cyanobacterium]
MTEALCILGSTGSIGTQVLDVVRRFPERFQVKALAAGKNIELLASQVQEFQPGAVSVQTPELADALRVLLPDYRGKILTGVEGLNRLAEWPEAPTVIVGLVGLLGLEPSLKALQAGKKLITANKETFVAGGHLVSAYLDQILPIDSEHSAIHQCLCGQDRAAIETIYLTASGGPFRTWSREAMASVTLEQALKHPNWVMGPRITIDSATMMNKGLEVIEAHWLFGLPYEQIQVIVHPESILHSGVAFKDGSVLMQMGVADMHVPIQYAMTYPERLPNLEPGVKLDLLSLSSLNLEPPDFERFPCLRLAYEAGRIGGGATAVLNSADEMAVQLFLERKIGFMDIPRLLEATLASYDTLNASLRPSLEEIQGLDTWARRFVLEKSGRESTLCS